VGGNGSGKTTLLKAAAGLLTPARGKIRNAHLSNQGFLPQNPAALFVCDSVAEELHEWASTAGYSAQDEQAALERAGLVQHAGQHPFDLSGGQQQKLALEKILLCQPDLLLLDEPAKGLDARAAAELIRRLREAAASGCTMVIATHNLDFARCVADEIALIFDGQIAAAADPETFFADNMLYRPHETSRLYGALSS